MKNLTLLFCVFFSFTLFSQEGKVKMYKATNVTKTFFGDEGASINKSATGKSFSNNTSKSGGGTINGSIVADLSVSSSGGVNYSVPINVPPGLNGIQPEISLDFDSHSGNGLAGWGWNLSGISVITRIPSTMFHDNQIDPVDFDLDDRFALDGQRLIVKSGTYGVAGSEYQTEQYSNLKIVAYGSNPVSGVQGPQYFKVFYPDGSIAHYGTTPNSRSHKDYAITYWENPQGIRISYEYQTLNNTLRIYKIKYGSRGTAIPVNEIEFTYVNRKFNEMAYIGGVQFVRNHLLGSIRVLGNGGNQHRKYNLNYGHYTHLRYQRLERVIEYIGDNSEFRKIDFTYNGTSISTGAGDADLTTTYFSQNSGVAQINLNNAEQRNANVVSLDVNGNGKMDFIVYPIIGPDAKKKFWLYDNIQSSINYSSPIDEGTFEEIFPVNWLDNQNRMRTSQALALVQNTGNTQVGFKIMAEAAPSSGVAIATEYTKTWNAPSIQYDNSNCGSPTYHRIEREYLSGDFDGDGLSDVMALSKGSYYARTCYPIGGGSCNCGGATLVQPKTAHLVRLDRRLPSTSGFVSAVGNLQNSIGSNDKLLAMDVTGDGRSNIVHITTGKVVVYGLNETNISLVKLWETPDSNIDLDFPPLPGDYNGDGKGDFLLPKANNSGGHLMFISTGTGYDVRDQGWSFTFRFSEDTGGTFYGYNLIPADINGDGKTDIIEYNTQVNHNSTSGTQTIRVHQNVVVTNTPSTNVYPVFFATNTTNSTVNMETFPIPIFLSSDKPNGNLEFASVSDKWVRSFEFLKDHREDVTLNNITNNGVVTTIAYDHVNSDSYSSLPGYTAPSGLYTQTYPFVNVNVSPSFKVVKELEQTGAGLTRKQEFHYEGAVSHATGLGFLGFEIMKQSNWYGTDVPALWTISKYDPLLRGAIMEQLVSNTSSSNPSSYMSKVNYFYDYQLIANPGSPIAPQITENISRNSSLPGAQTDEVEEFVALLPGFHAIGSNGSYWAYIFPPNEQPGDTGYAGAVDIRLNKIETNNGLTGVFTTETYSYDQFNNPLLRTTTYPGGSRVVSYKYLNNQTAANNTYHIGRLQKMTESVTLNGNSFSTEQQYTYNNNLVTQVKKKGNGTGWLTEDFTHNVNGNILTKTLSGNGVASRTTTFEYSSTYGERFLTKSTDIEGLTTTFTYDNVTGSLLSTTDPYSVTTSFEYDKWDRIEKETDYLTNATDHTYTILSGGALQHNVDYATGAKERTTYNAFGWMTQTGTLSLNNQWVYKDYEYYVDGKPKRESEPHHSSPSQWNTTVYDEYSRPISQTLNTGRNITYTYTGLSSTVNDGVKSTTTTSDALGNTIKVQDPGGIVDYTYFANGTMKTADYGGNVVTVGIDGWGRKTSLNDPSAGTYGYTYNEFGEQLTATSPKGTTTYTYDDYGKVTSETMTGDLTDHSLSYVYDNTTKLLKTINGLDNTNSARAYTYQYTYDAYQRQKKVTEDTGLANFEYDITYDPQYGRVEKEKLTSNLTNGASKILTTRNVYDTSGILKEIWNDGTPDKLWELGSINARGQALTINLGSGMTKTKVYDAYGYLTKIEDKESGTNPTVALHTEYDFNAQRGTLNSRENFGFNWQESFGYDNLDRLTTITGDATKTMTYDTRGRITNNTALGTYEYGDTSKKYRLTEIDPNTAGGNYFQQHPTQQISYNAFKKPVDIHQQGHGRVSFEYGPMMARSTAYYGGEQSDETQRRYKKHYSAIIPVEIVEDTQTGTSKIITYVAGDAYSAPIAHIKTTGTGAIDEYHYLHRDYLGSILAITDADGDVKEELQFGAWGSVDQFLDSSSGTTFGHGSLLGRGYTGHEHFFEVGLIHMNGRMYDAELGRFLSPDNYIQDPFNTQNHNRYGYVLNNPLMYTDPSGESFWRSLGDGFTGIGNFIGSVFTGIAKFFGWTGGEEYIYGAPVQEPPTPRMNNNNSNISSSISNNGPSQSTGGPSPWKNRLSQYWDGFTTGYKGHFTGIKDGVVNYWDRMKSDFWGQAKDNYQEGLKNFIPGRAAYKMVIEPQVDRVVNLYKSSEALYNGDYYGAGTIAGNQAAGDTVELGTLPLGGGVGKVFTKGFGRIFSRFTRNARGSKYAFGLKNVVPKFADDIGAIHLMKDPNWKSSFMKAINNPNNKLHFNLNGIDSKPMQMIMNPGRSGINWEMNALYQNSAAFERTIFHYGGKTYRAYDIFKINP